MKTYLTDTEFVEVFWRELERRMDYHYGTGASTGDTILWYLFRKYEKDIKETLEGSLYGIDEYSGDKASNLIGYQFHKSFRQVDVINDPCIDTVIWTCLQDAPVFWKCMDKACKILISADLAEHYRESMEQ